MRPIAKAFVGSLLVLFATFFYALTLLPSHPLTALIMLIVICTAIVLVTTKYEMLEEKREDKPEHFRITYRK